MLRKYQEHLVSDLRVALRYHDRVLGVLPTGGGKTVVFSHIARAAAARNRSVTVLVHRQELLQQATGYLGDCCEVATIQSWKPEKRDLIIVDEAHHAVARTWQEKLKAAESKILGFTATPQRLDGSGLSTVFDHLIQGPTVRQLMYGGFLSPYRLLGPPGKPDLSGIKRLRGDYNRTKLGQAVSEKKVVAAGVKNWLMYAKDRQTICFCVSVAHMEAVLKQFQAAGIKAASIDGTTRPSLRALRVQQFAEKKIQVLLSVDLISEGFDVPDCDCVLLLRPTQSLGLFLQQVGRGLRPSDRECLILDCAGNAERHGMPDDDREWSLEGQGPRSREGVAAVPVRVCSQCYSVHRPNLRTCPYCGFNHPLDARIPEEAEIILQEKKKVAREMRREVGRARTVDELMEIAKERGYAIGWVDRILRSRGARY
jgi:DNA repair protein RadD